MDGLEERTRERDERQPNEKVNYKMDGRERERENEREREMLTTKTTTAEINDDFQYVEKVKVKLAVTWRTKRTVQYVRSEILWTTCMYRSDQKERNKK